MRMNDNVPLAVAYYLNGANFRMSAEKLREGLELDDSGRPAKLTAIPAVFSRKPRGGALSKSSVA